MKFNFDVNMPLNPEKLIAYSKYKIFLAQTVRQMPTYKHIIIEYYSTEASHLALWVDLAL